MILTAKMKKGKLISYLIGGGGAIVFVELVILMTRKNFLDKKAYLVPQALQYVCIILNFF